MKSKPKFRWRVFVATLLGIYLLRGIVLACVVPPLEMWDEYQHLAYIDCVASTGHVPVLGTDRVNPNLLRQILRLPASAPEWAQLSRFGALTYAQYWDRASDRPIVQIHSETLELYEAQHPPVYYWLVSPIYRRLGADLPRVVSVLRLLNVAFTAIGLGAILIWLGKNCRDPVHAALMGLSVVLQPLFLLNADRVANDGLAIMLGSLAIVWAMSMGSHWIRMQSLGLGILIGLGVITKATDLVLLPFACFCLMHSAFQKPGMRWRVWMESCALLILGTAVIAGPYVRWSLHQYGLITPMQEAITNRAAHARPADYLRYAPINLSSILHWRIMVQHWIIADGLWVGGWTGLRPPRWLTTVYEILMVLSALAWIPRLVRQIPATTVNPFNQKFVGTRILALCLLMLLAMCYHSIESMVALQGASATTPWYASMVVPWFLIALFSGPIALRGTLSRRLGCCIALLLCILFFGTETYGICFQMVPRYSCLRLSVDAWRRLSTLHPRWLNGITLSAAAAAELSLLATAAMLIISNTHQLSPAEKESE